MYLCLESPSITANVSSIVSSTFVLDLNRQVNIESRLKYYGRYFYIHNGVALDIVVVVAGAALGGAGVRHTRHVDPQLRQAAGEGLNMMAFTGFGRKF